MSIFIGLVEFFDLYLLVEVLDLLVAGVLYTKGLEFLVYFLECNDLGLEDLLQKHTHYAHGPLLGLLLLIILFDVGAMTHAVLDKHLNELLGQIHHD